MVPFGLERADRDVVVIVVVEQQRRAHNVYLELVLELGLPGLVLIDLFPGWWAPVAAGVWTSPLMTPFGRRLRSVEPAGQGERRQPRHVKLG